MKYHATRTVKFPASARSRRAGLRNPHPVHFQKQAKNRYSDGLGQLPMKKMPYDHTCVLS